MLQVKGISFAYTQDAPTLKNISFKVEKGEHVAIIGQSGCGKSTLLHLVFGNLDLDDGEIYWKDEQVLGPAFNLIPGLEDVKLLTQEFDLMPFISVEENVKKHLSRMYPEENQAISDQLLATVEMTDYAKTKVKYLSGGQKQRVGIAQVLAKKPNLLLLDEPFSHIDQYKKNKLRRDLFAFLKKEKITCLFATHDVKDMLSFSDKTLVLEDGELVDYRPPQQLYQKPKSYKIASLFEEVNMVSGEYIQEGDTKKYVVYPHEVLIHPSKGRFKAIVEKSFFMADRYLVSLLHKRQKFFAFHSKEILENTWVYISVSLENPADRAIELN